MLYHPLLPSSRSNAATGDRCFSSSTFHISSVAALCVAMEINHAASENCTVLDIKGLPLMSHWFIFLSFMNRLIFDGVKHASALLIITLYFISNMCFSKVMLTYLDQIFVLAGTKRTALLRCFLALMESENWPLEENEFWRSSPWFQFLHFSNCLLQEHSWIQLWRRK